MVKDKKTKTDVIEIKEEKVEAKVEPKKEEVKKEVKKEEVKEIKAKKPKTEKKKKEDKKMRSFKAIFYNPAGEPTSEGRYCGQKPKQAACKALTGIFKTYKGEGKPHPTDVKFGIIETTRSSRHKNYWYIGKREKLHEPVSISIEKDGKINNIVYNFNNIVKKLNEDECADLAKCVTKKDETAEAEIPKKVKKVAGKVKKIVKKEKKAKKTEKVDDE